MSTESTSAVPPRKRRWWLLILLCLAAFIALLVRGYYDYVYGPSAEEAFRRYIADPIPPSVANLRIRYTPHMKGYWIYLVFEIDPEELDELFADVQFEPTYSTAGDYFKGWISEDRFREMEGGEFMDMRTARLARVAAYNCLCEIVVSRDRRKVYYYRFSDSDLQSIESGPN